MKMAVRISVVMLVWESVCFGQGTLEINFDGPPNQVAGSGRVVQSYSESGMLFQPTADGDGFTRIWSNPPTGLPDNITPYLDASGGDSLSFKNVNGGEFGLVSVDLAGYSDVVPDFCITFIGYHTDGSTITTSFSGSGIGFQTYNFGSDWSSGLTRVEIPNYGWSLDNLVVSVPEPSAGSLFILGAVTMFFRWRERK